MVWHVKKRSSSIVKPCFTFGKIVCHIANTKFSCVSVIYNIFKKYLSAYVYKNISIKFFASYLYRKCVLIMKTLNNNITINRR